MRREYLHKNTFLMMTWCCYLTPISMGKRIQSIALASLNRSARRSTKEDGGNDSERKSEQTERIFQQRINLHTWPVQTDVREKNTRTLKNRLGMASNAFRILKNTLRFQQDRIKTKVNLYQSCILPSVL